MLIGTTFCALALPTVMSYIVDNGIKANNFNVVLYASLIMFGVAVIACVLSFAEAKLLSGFTAAVAVQMRADVFERVNNMPLAEINRIGKGALLSRSTQDINMLNDFLTMFVSVAVTVPFMIIGGSILAFMADWLIALVILLASPLIISLTFFVGKRVHPLYKVANKYIDRQNTIVRERLTGIRIIRAFDREADEHERIEDATVQMANNLIKANVYMGVISPVGLLLMNSVTVLILYLCSVNVQLPDAALRVGDMVAIIQYVSLIMTAIFNSAFIIVWMPRVKVSLDRVGEVFATTPIDRNDKPKTLNGTIEGEGVGYAYPGSDTNALEPLDFKIDSGDKVAFIGGTGAGKSTLLNLFTGLTLNTCGTLKIGGEDASALTVDDVVNNVTTVFQKSDIFSGTIRDNVDPAHEHSDEEVFAALSDAQFGDFVSENGLDYQITQNGSNLSGGQKQRLAIARAFLKPASIYLFDDSFSALDYLTEKRLRSRMNETLKGSTLIIATQRVSTALNCDKIFVFDAGRLVGHGKHEELMNSCEVYREIYTSQTGGELNAAQN